MWRTFDSFVHGDGVKTRNALLTYDSHPHETKESSPKPAFSPNTKRRTWVNKQVPAGNQTCLITERYHQQKSSPSGNPNKIHKNPLTARFPQWFPRHPFALGPLGGGPGDSMLTSRGLWQCTLESIQLGRKSGWNWHLIMAKKHVKKGQNNNKPSPK